MSTPERRSPQEAPGFSQDDIGYMRSFTDSVHLMYRRFESDPPDNWHMLISGTVNSYFDGIDSYRRQGNDTEAVEAVFIAESLGMGITEINVQSRVADALRGNPLLSDDQKHVLLSLGSEAINVGPSIDDSLRRQQLTDMAGDALIQYQRNREGGASPDIYEVSLHAFAAGVNAASPYAGVIFDQLGSAMYRYKPSTEQ